MDKYKYVLLMSAVILTIIIGYYTIITAEIPIVEPEALNVEIRTDDTTYLLGEEIEVSIYLYNNRLTTVQIRKEEGLSVWTNVIISSSFHDLYRISPFEGLSLTVNAKTRILYGKITFQAEVTGTYTIECLGEQITLKVIFHREASNL